MDVEAAPREGVGHSVLASTSFYEIESLLQPGAFDAGFVDHVMPDMSGLAILRELSRRGCRQPIVIITGEPDDGEREAAVRAGAFDYLAKPVTKEMLLKTIGRVVGTAPSDEP